MAKSKNTDKKYGNGMDFLEVREDLRVVVKILKKELRKRNKYLNEIRKVEEFNILSHEIDRLGKSIELIDIVLWMLKVDR